MSTAAIVGGSLLGAGASVGSSLIGAHAAGKAADAQARAADEAAQLQFQLGQENLGFQEQQYRNTLGLEEPGYLTGMESLGSLAQLMGLAPQAPNTGIFENPFGSNGTPQLPTSIPGAGISPGTVSRFAPLEASATMNRDGGPIFEHTPPQPIGFNNGTGPVSANGNPAQLTVANSNGVPSGPGGLPPGFLTQLFNNGQGFTAPTLEEARSTPGYQFALDTGTQALENSAAAKGNLISGNEAEALQKFGTGLADSTYNDVYNRALNTFNTNYNAFNQNQNSIFNRFADIAGLGQTATGQLASSGLSTGSNIGNLLNSLGGQIGSDITNAGAARASGYVGAANALGGGISGLSNLALLYRLFGGGGGGGSAANLGIFGDSLLTGAAGA